MNITHVKLKVKLILQEVMNKPAFAEPSGPGFVRLETEPVIISRLVVLYVL